MKKKVYREKYYGKKEEPKEASKEIQKKGKKNND